MYDKNYNIFLIVENLCFTALLFYVSNTEIINW